jgi:hypothetical protein
VILISEHGPGLGVRDSNSLMIVHRQSLHEW